MKRGLQGRLQLRRTSPEPYRAFVPDPLPPKPPLELTGGLLDLHDQANRALGKLAGAIGALPNGSLLLYFYVRKEAVLSSQIEGTQSSLSDLLRFESADIPGVPLEDVEEVSTYVRAVNLGMERIAEGMPLTGRLMREVHGALLSSARGRAKQPGEFRRSQNWIGGTRPGNAAFVPPPHEEVPRLISQLERFLHDMPERTATLVKAGLAHVQLETIHPFLDGNGRLGRLLITLILCYEKALPAPLLYLSLYLKTHRGRYYELLQQVRVEGDWEAWLEFFFEGVRDIAEQAVATSTRIAQLIDSDRLKIAGLRGGRDSALRVHAHLQHKPVAHIPDAARAVGLSQPTVTAALSRLAQLGIVQSPGDRRRNRTFTYTRYLEILDEGTEPL